MILSIYKKRIICNNVWEMKSYASFMYLLLITVVHIIIYNLSDTHLLYCYRDRYTISCVHPFKHAWYNKRRESRAYVRQLMNSSSYIYIYSIKHIDMAVNLQLTLIVRSLLMSIGEGWTINEHKNDSVCILFVNACGSACCVVLTLPLDRSLNDVRKNYSLRRKFKKSTVHVVEATMELKATRQIFPRLLVSGDQMSVQITCAHVQSSSLR